MQSSAQTLIYSKIHTESLGYGPKIPAPHHANKRLKAFVMLKLLLFALCLGSPLAAQIEFHEQLFLNDRLARKLGEELGGSRVSNPVLDSVSNAILLGETIQRTQLLRSQQALVEQQTALLKRQQQRYSTPEQDQPPPPRSSLATFLQDSPEAMPYLEAMASAHRIIFFESVLEPDARDRFVYRTLYLAETSRERIRNLIAIWRDAEAREIRNSSELGSIARPYYPQYAPLSDRMLGQVLALDTPEFFLVYEIRSRTTEEKAMTFEDLGAITARSFPGYADLNYEELGQALCLKYPELFSDVALASSGLQTPSFTVGSAN